MSPTKHGNVLSWASDIEPETLEQANRTASMPFVQGHLALMPDAHVGMGATVGSVIPTKGAIIPAAIGVDIGCGMIATELDFHADRLPDDLGALLSRIEEVVPAGLGKGHDTERMIPAAGWATANLTDRELRAALTQMGSLGGGNHFVEVCLDERDKVWVVLHSGSRGVGKQFAERHIEGAKGLMKRYLIDLPDPDLAYLVEGTPEFDAYIEGMLWAQEWAMSNRQAMMDAVLAEVAKAVEWRGDSPATMVVGDAVNCHHNFTERENHGGQNVWLTRKGAIRARVGDRGVIPGSMGTRSYIVSGKGSKASYDSCSHGAGRRFSRTQAKKRITMAEFEQAMEGKTWLTGRAADLLDEAPGAYKDIDQVMADQADLVRVEHTLSQVLNFKGTR